MGRAGLRNLLRHVINSTITVGPWGVQEGIFWDDGVYSTVRQVEIAHGTCIDAIRFEYETKGASVWSEKHGGLGGFKIDKIKLEYPNEFLTSIHGYLGSLIEWGPILIRSLTFESNKRTYGSYGIEQGTYFSLPIIGGKIVGFHGKCGWYLHAIGVHLEPVHKPIHSSYSMVQYPSNSSNQQGKIVHPLHSPSNSSNEQERFFPPIECPLIFCPSNSSNQQGKIVHPLHSPSNSSNEQEKFFPPIEYQFRNQPELFDSPINSSSKQQYPSNQVNNPQWYNRIGKRVTEQGATEEAIQRIIKDPAPSGPGSWGGDGGKPWDDGVFTGIKKIILIRAQAIRSIQIEYDRNGQSVWSVNHGGTGGHTAHQIKLEYPHEVVTCVSGYYGALNEEEGVKVIKSLTFFTSRSKCGPFGEEIGTFFSSTTTEGEVVGFYGRSGMYLDAVGVHMQHWLGNQRAVKPSSLLKCFS